MVMDVNRFGDTGLALYRQRRVMNILRMANSIKFYRERAGLTQAALGERIGTSGQQIQRLEQSMRKLSVDWMRRLAPVLDVEPADLMESPPRPKPDSAMDEAVFNREEKRSSYGPWIPVQSGGRGGVDQQMYWTEGLGFTRRPPSLIDIKGAYSVYMVGESMAPRYLPGWLLFIDPTKPATDGRAVVVRKSNDVVLVKLFRGYERGNLALEQLNPPEMIYVPSTEVETIHVVTGTQEED